MRIPFLSFRRQPPGKPSGTDPTEDANGINGLTQDQCRDWLTLCASIRGESHVRRDVPNQDTARVETEGPDSPWLMMAVADGHGSPKCFRSDQGSKFAIDAAFRALKGFADNSASLELSAIRAGAQVRLAREIVRSWDEAVAMDIQDSPFVEREVPAEAARALAARPQLAYGSTLIAALFTPRYLVAIQIGDGDFLIVDDGFEVHAPMATGESLALDETTSLCQPDSWKEFRQCFVPILTESQAQTRPVLVMASTDGYSNSFGNKDGIEHAARDLTLMARDHGWAAVSDAMPDWLSETASKGSQDDVSLVAAVNRGSLARLSQEASLTPTGQDAMATEGRTRVESDNFSEVDRGTA